MLAVLGGLAEFERGLFNAWTDEGRKRAKVSGVEFGRKQKLTPHQEALAGPADGEALTGIGRTFGVIHSTILRLALSSTLRRPQSVLLSTHFPPVVDSNEVGGPYYGKRLWGMRTALVRMTSRCVRIAAIALLNELRRRMHQPIPEQGTMAEANHYRLLPVPRSANELGCTGHLSGRDHSAVAMESSSPESKEPAHLDPNEEADG